MISNKLMLNDAQTELLVIAPRQHIGVIKTYNPVVKIGDALISPVEYLRNLGALFDQNMHLYYLYIQ